jgi:dihydrofolate reductase
MAKLIYSALCSLDHYTRDTEGSFKWAGPDEEVHAFINDQERDVGTYLYGRRVYEVMRAWQDFDTETIPPVYGDFAKLWQAADKIVFSRTMTDVSTPRTTLRKDFDPDEIRALKQSSDRPIGIGGSTLAAEAMRAGLVDQLNLYVFPVIVGGGLPAIPAGLEWDLTLVGEKRFSSGTVFLSYDTRS